MNAMIPVFPGPDNLPFTEQEIIDIVISIVPMSWRTTLARMNFEPFDANVLEVQTALEKIELLEKCESLSLEHKKRKTSGAPQPNWKEGKKPHQQEASLHHRQRSDPPRQPHPVWPDGEEKEEE